MDTVEIVRMMNEIEVARKAMDMLYRDTVEYPVADTMDEDELTEICEFTGNSQAEYITLSNSVAQQYREAKARWEEISARNLPLVEALMGS